MVLQTVREDAGELEKAIFLVVYCSRKQQFKRIIAMLVLIIKYISCGMILVWPFYLLFFLLILSPVTAEYIWYTLFFIPGALFWLRIYLKSAFKEYRRSVKDHILNKGFIRELMLGS